MFLINCMAKARLAPLALGPGPSLLILPTLPTSVFTVEARVKKKDL